MEGSLRPLVRVATGSVFVLVALQVAARATRDTLFLSQFPVAALPAMVAGGALASIAVAVVATRGLTTLGPPRFVPRAFVAGAAVTLATWAVALAAPRTGAVLFYLYAASLSPVLLAGFWSLLSERVDPRTARRALGRIAAVGTLGGLAGGLLAERLAAGLGTLAILPALALAQGACAWGTARMGAVAPAPAGDAARAVEPTPTPESYRRLATTPYLRNLALLVFGGAMGAAFLDFVFKAEVAGAAAGEPALMRTFATFYSAVALLTLAFQALFARPALEQLGLARTMGLLPATVVIGGVTAALAPGPWTVGVLRGLEAVFRGSLHRGGYEILFTPIPPAEKRATRLLIDVGCERMGDLAGAALLGLVLALVPGSPAPVLLALAALLAAATLGVVLRVQRGYVASLEAGLRAGALRLDPALVTDRTTWLTLHGTRGGTVSSGGSAPASAAAVAAGGLAERSAAEPLPDVDTPEGVRAAIGLLADDRRARRVHDLLVPVAERHVELLVAALLDPATELGVRRRLPAVLAAAPGPRAADGLTRGLADPRFEVRYRCGRALARVLECDPGTWVDGDRVIAAARREAELDRTVWESQRLLDQLDEPVADTFVDDVLRDRAGRSLEHVFTLLSLVLDPEPLRIAFRGLLSGDRLQRGTALEYLDVVLPPSVHAVLWPHLEPERRRRAPASPARDRSAVLADLLRSHASIEIDAAALRERIRPDG